MPYDITMCPGGECPLRRRCYRFRAVAVGRQDWLATPPYDPATGRCGWLWDLAALGPTEEQVRGRAYAIWLAEGRPDGHARTHWLQARAELERAVAELLDEARGAR